MNKQTKTQSITLTDDALQAIIAQAVSAALANNTPKASNGKGQKDKGQSKAKATYQAKLDKINAAKTEALTRTMPDAVKLAVAQIKHNQGQGFVNAKIDATSPNSFRRFLQSHENQALRATRDANGVSYADVESMLDKAMTSKKVKA